MGSSPRTGQRRSERKSASNHKVDGIACYALKPSLLTLGAEQMQTILLRIHWYPLLWSLGALIPVWLGVRNYPWYGTDPILYVIICLAAAQVVLAHCGAFLINRNRRWCITAILALLSLFMMMLATTTRYVPFIYAI